VGDPQSSPWLFHSPCPLRSLNVFTVVYGIDGIACVLAPYEYHWELPSGKQPHNYRKSPCYQWVNPLFLWAIFNSKVLVYQRVTSIRFHRWNPRTRPSEWIQGVWVVRHQLPSKTKWWDSATRNIRGSPISNTPIISAWHEKSPGVDPSFPVNPPEKVECELVRQKKTACWLNQYMLNLHFGSFWIFYRWLTFCFHGHFRKL